MTLKRRIEKLEPAARKAWEKAWEEIFDAPEARPFMDRVYAFMDRLNAMTEEEHANLDALIINRDSASG